MPDTQQTIHGLRATHLNERAAADFLGISIHTLKKRRVEGRPPVFLKIGRSVRYRVRDLEAFSEACARGS